MNDAPENNPFWLKGGDNRVSLYSSVRISRNYRGMNFPSSPGYGSFREVEKRTDDILSAYLQSGRIKKVSLATVSQDQMVLYKKLRLLPEKRNALLSKFSFYHDSEKGAWLLTNYNDHLTFFANSQGTKIKKAYSDCSCFLRLFDESLLSADGNGNFHTSELGYFGSGLKCFSVLTLPALGISGETDSVIPSVRHNGYSVRNCFGRQAEGSFLIISNRDSYSKTAASILNDFVKLLSVLKIKMFELEEEKDGLTEVLAGKCKEIINYETLTFDDFIRIYYMLSFLRVRGRTGIGISRINSLLRRVILDSPGTEPGYVIRRSLKDEIFDSVKKYLK